MFSKVLLASLFVSAAVAAPPPAVRDTVAPPIINLESNVSPAGPVAPNPNPSPSLSVILLNSPSASPPVASGYYGDYAAPAQPPANPAVINLNAPAAAFPTIIQLKKRQSIPTPSSNTFSFGGIVPTSTPTLSPPSLSTPSTTTTSSSVTPAPLPTTTPNPAAQGGLSTFISTGTNGIETVFILSAVTVTVTPPCSVPPAVPSSEPVPAFPPAQSFATPPILPSIVPSSSVSSPFPSLANINAQAPAPAIPPTSVVTPSISPINLSAPSSVTPAPTNPGIFFSSASPPTLTPTPFPVNAAAPANCDLDCLLTASV